MHKLLKFASIYLAQAELKTNMAIRIIHSLIPTLVADTATQQESKDLHGFLAQDLIPGAEEVYNYGVKAIGHEYELASNTHSMNQVLAAIQYNNYDLAIDLAIDGFEKDFYASGQIGGKPWKTFAEMLKKLKQQIDITKRTKSKDDALKLSAYLNAIDSLSHNSGAFMDKLVYEELYEQKEGDTKKHEKNTRDLIKMRDTTTLTDIDQIITLIQNNSEIMNRIPSDYKKLINEYRKLHPLKPGDLEKGIENLANTQLLKDIERQQKEQAEWEKLIGQVYKSKSS